MTLTTWEALTVPQPRPPEVEVRLPPLDEVVDNWPVLAPMLERATRRTGCFEPIDILRGAILGAFGVWFCQVEGEIVAAVVTEVHQYPRKRVLEIAFCGGTKMRQWIGPLVDALEAHGRECGCSHVATSGRPGWVKVSGGYASGDIVIIVRDIERSE